MERLCGRMSYFASLAISAGGEGGRGEEGERGELWARAGSGWAHRTKGLWDCSHLSFSPLIHIHSAIFSLAQLYFKP